MTTAQGGGKFVSLTHRPHLPPGNPPGTHFCWVGPGHVLRSEGLCQWKIPMTPPGIEPATFRFVAQHLKHCATAVPYYIYKYFCNEKRVFFPLNYYLIYEFIQTEWDVVFWNLTSTVQRKHENSLGNKEFEFAGSFFVLCCALLEKNFSALSEVISFRKINTVPTNKHEEDRKCKIPM